MLRYGIGLNLVIGPYVVLGLLGGAGYLAMSGEPRRALLLGAAALWSVVFYMAIRLMDRSMRRARAREVGDETESGRSSSGRGDS